MNILGYAVIDRDTKGFKVGESVNITDINLDKEQVRVSNKNQTNKQWIHLDDAIPVE